MITRYIVALDAGGEIQVVTQNLETSSAQALEQKGRQTVVGWRPEHAVAVKREENTKGGPSESEIRSTQHDGHGSP